MQLPDGFTSGRCWARSSLSSALVSAAVQVEKSGALRVAEVGKEGSQTDNSKDGRQV